MMTSCDLLNNGSENKNMIRSINEMESKQENEDEIKTRGWK